MCRGAICSYDSELSVYYPVNATQDRELSFLSMYTHRKKSSSCLVHGQIIRPTCFDPLRAPSLPIYDTSTRYARVDNERRTKSAKTERRYCVFYMNAPNEHRSRDVVMSLVDYISRTTHTDERVYMHVCESAAHERLCTHHCFFIKGGGDSHDKEGHRNIGASQAV